MDHCSTAWLGWTEAGVDPLAGDRLGRLARSRAGMRQRDALVFEAAASRAVRGDARRRDARRIEATVEAHCNTLRVARAVFA